MDCILTNWQHFTFGKMEKKGGGAATTATLTA